MNSNDRILVETMVRKAIKDIKNSPERGTRNIIDFALNFANGRFQQEFLKTAQKMFENENSQYFRMIRDIVFNVNTEKLITFGMNVGYNSCTFGAKRIREIENNENFDIPWTVSLEIRNSKKHTSLYNSVFEQGEKIGIHTWQIFVSEITDDILSLISAHRNSAFVLFCEPKCITEPLTEKATDINNMMFAVRYNDDSTADACSLLRRNGFLYSVYFPYTESDIEFITKGEFFSSSEILYPAFSILLPEQFCTKQTCNAVYDYVVKARDEQLFRTLPWEAVSDSCYIDRIISEDACFARFDKDGCFSSFGETKAEDDYNLFKRRLVDIFRRTLPKQDLS